MLRHLGLLIELSIRIIGFTSQLQRTVAGHQAEAYDDRRWPKVTSLQQICKKSNVFQSMRLKFLMNSKGNCAIQRVLKLVREQSELARKAEKAEKTLRRWFFGTECFASSVHAFWELPRPRRAAQTWCWSPVRTESDS